jgi:3-oxoacyl-[acyl-carrier-protein] synthase II
LINLASGYVSIRYGLKGPNHSVVTACSTGAHAIGDAARLIALGDAEVMVAGGTESAVNRIGMAGFVACRALSTSFNDEPTRASRPYDRDRDGFVMGEGAGILILEAEEDARARGATILGELRGGASTGDAHHITAPHPTGEGAARAMRLALEDAGISPDEVRYVNAHGTGTDLNDRTEGAVIDRLFETQPAVSSIKGTTGHALGASGSIEAAVVVEAMRRHELPPNIGLTSQDPEIPLTDIVDAPREWEPGPAVTNSFGFGGHNTVLVFTPPA